MMKETLVFFKAMEPDHRHGAHPLHVIGFTRCDGFTKVHLSSGATLETPLPVQDLMQAFDQRMAEITRKANSPIMRPS